jgi:hypothetical protein
MKRELIEPCPESRLEYRMLFYTLPGNAWRVDAMLPLLNEPGAWSDSCERRFGELPGLKSWQIDYWLTHGRALVDA